MRRPPLALWVLAGLLATSVGSLAQAPLGLPTPAELRRTVEELTAPELAGRRSGTPGADRAAGALEGQLAAAGLRPGGDAGGFLQAFVLEHAPTPSAASSLSLGGHGDRLALGAEWVPHGGSRRGRAAGEVAFVGYGATAEGWDDYAGLDVRGRIVLALDGAPPHVPGARASRLEKLILARARGAAALLVASDPLPTLRATGSAVDLVSGGVTTAAADRLLAPAERTVGGLADTIARTRTPAAFLTGARARLRVELGRAEVSALNVVGLVPGTDPRLAAEAVVVGAHYDHVGVVNGAVHPGADDNASGTAVALGLARAFAAAGGAPRPLVFVFFGAEELGLLGAGHYVRRPALPPPARTVAMVNLDMVGRMRDAPLRVGGVDSGRDLRRLVGEAARAEGVPAELVGSPFSASDHRRFYEAGTPVLFFSTGVHADYHRPGDTADRVDADGLARVAALAARVVGELAAGPPPAYVALEPRGRRAREPAPAAGPVFLGVGAGRTGDGVPLSHVVPGSAAADAGLREGDVLVRFGDATVDSFDDLRAALGRGRAGDRVRVVYLREGLVLTSTAVLGPRP